MATRYGRDGYEIGGGTIHFPQINMICAKIVGQMSGQKDKTADIW